MSLDDAISGILMTFEQNPPLLIFAILAIAVTVIIIKYLDKIKEANKEVDEANPAHVAKDYIKRNCDEKDRRILYKRTDTGLVKLGQIKYSGTESVPNHDLFPLPLMREDPHEESQGFSDEIDDEELEFKEVKMFVVENEKFSKLDRIINKLKGVDNDEYYCLTPNSLEDDAADSVIIGDGIVLESSYEIKHDRLTESRNVVSKGIQKGFAKELAKNQFNLPRYVNKANQRHSMRNENIAERNKDKSNEEI